MPEVEPPRCSDTREDQHEQHQKNRKSNSKVCEKRTEQAKSLEDRVTHGLKRTNESSFSAHK